MRTRATLLTLVVLLPIAAAAEVDESTPPRITVNGRATVQVDPDRAVLTVGVETQRESAGAAQSETNRIARAILEAVEALDVPATAIQTSSLNLQPIYSQRRPGGEPYVPELVAYRADNTVQITLIDLDKVGPAIDAALAAGANRVTGLTFSLRDEDPAQRQALRAAVLSAVAKAEVIAEALGRQLGAVIEVREGNVSLRPIAAGRQYAEMAADSGAPVATGQVTASASVTITYSLEE